MFGFVISLTIVLITFCYVVTSRTLPVFVHFTSQFIIFGFGKRRMGNSLLNIDVVAYIALDTYAILVIDVRYNSGNLQPDMSSFLSCEDC